MIYQHFYSYIILYFLSLFVTKAVENFLIYLNEEKSTFATDVESALIYSDELESN